MKSRLLIISALLLLKVSLFGQELTKPVAAPQLNDFAPVHSFLASDWMEGREAGTKGSFIAADFIATEMQLFGLKPVNGNSDYFQNFEVMRYKTEIASLAFIKRNAASQSTIQFIKGTDFEVQTGSKSTDAEAQVVFAGYGMSVPGKGYDDYKGIDVNGKIVLLVQGFPGCGDTTSMAWKKLGKSPDEDGWGSVETKVRTAKRLGALAIVLIDAKGNYEPYRYDQANRSLLKSTMNSTKNEDPDYEDSEYTLPDDSTTDLIPLFRVGSSACRELVNGTGVNPADFELKAAKQFIPASCQLKDRFLKVSVTVKTEPLLVRNVMGMIPGTDNSKYIVIGAHYDHEGVRNGLIYNGSDDNASGTAGMLALARKWSESSEKPVCNLIFAAWTAEEKGLIGSSYFTQTLDKKPKNISLYINMDMISRSAPEDTARRIISVGTRTADEHLRELARSTNATIEHPFSLDLWDVTGHSGSDYASFTAKNIPVMTFFSGFHNDYHTPRDISAKADLIKMGDVLKVVNGCLNSFLNIKK